MFRLVKQDYELRNYDMAKVVSFTIIYIIKQVFPRVCIVVWLETNHKYNTPAVTKIFKSLNLIPNSNS